MKTLNGLSFGFSSVNAGQRNVVIEPQVIAVSTEGGFRVTPPVSRVLGLQHGDYVMFLSNVEQIDAAIASNAPAIVEFCEQNGLEVGSPEAAIALHKEYDTWAIAKGIVEYDLKGNQKTSTERLTIKDKQKYATQNFDIMLEAAMAQASDEVKEALSRDGVTKKEQIDILAAFVTPRELPKFRGSKCANPAGLAGSNISLNFTDSNIWKQLKADLGDEATKVNRAFSVDTDKTFKAVVSDGYKDVEVTAIELGAFDDKEPARIGSKDED